MQLHWLGFGGYRARHEPGFWEPWRAQYPDFHAVPEGGGGLAGALGCKVLKEQVIAQLGNLGWSNYHGWWLACGTGTTLAGWCWPRPVRIPCMAHWRCPRIMAWRRRWRRLCRRQVSLLPTTSCSTPVVAFRQG
jgi:hypothetical protein